MINVYAKLDKHIDQIVIREWCNKHQAPQTAPCWWIHKLDGTRSMAVCNTRAKRAGFYAEPSKASLRAK